MNQNEQMLREALQAIHARCVEAEFYGETLFADGIIKLIEQALAVEPEPLVRLTDADLKRIWGCSANWLQFGREVQQVLIAKNGGKV